MFFWQNVIIVDKLIDNFMSLYL